MCWPVTNAPMGGSFNSIPTDESGGFPGSDRTLTSLERETRMSYILDTSRVLLSPALTGKPRLACRASTAWFSRASAGQSKSSRSPFLPTAEAGGFSGGLR